DKVTELNANCCLMKPVEYDDLMAGVHPLAPTRPTFLGKSKKNNKKRPRPPKFLKKYIKTPPHAGIIKTTVPPHSRTFCSRSKRVLRSHSNALLRFLRLPNCYSPWPCRTNQGCL